MARLHRQTSASAAFTLVEMLVVIGIIAVLAALLLPAVNTVLTRGRNTAIAVEVNQIASAIEAYKQDKGDYPPNFRDPAVFMRHVRKCYPKCDASEITALINTAATPPAFNTGYALDEGEALVFWLSKTRDDPRFPFGFSASAPSAIAGGFSYKKYYDFDESRLFDGIDTDVTAGSVAGGPVVYWKVYTSRYCKDTPYIYIDSRSYVDTCRFTNTPYSEPASTYAYAEDITIGIRPYWSTTSSGATSTLTPPPIRTLFKPMNPTTFQLLCAGQDGDWGYLATDVDVKTFPTGTNANQSYNDGDNDNITNFSNGKTLKDNFPQ